jgi:hypothetical protein
MQSDPGGSWETHVEDEEEQKYPVMHCVSSVQLVRHAELFSHAKPPGHAMVPTGSQAPTLHSLSVTTAFVQLVPQGAPGAAFPHTPLAGLQAWHGPSHAVVQQTPLAQKVEAH